MTKRLTKRVRQALNRAGAVLVRQRTHLVFRLANGRKLVMAATPSDRRHWEQNVLRDIRAASPNVQPMTRVTVSRPRRRKPGRQDHRPSFAGLKPMQAALQDSGVVERQLRQRITDLERELSAWDTWWPVRIARALKQWTRVSNP